jgi:peptide/nickel transport system permease protein
VGEPVPSWGNMLAGAQRYHVLTSYWWMFTPGIALAAVFLLYYALTDALHNRLALRPSYPS